MLAIDLLKEKLDVLKIPGNYYQIRRCGNILPIDITVIQILTSLASDQFHLFKM